MRTLLALLILSVPFTLAAYLLGMYGDTLLRIFLKFILDAAGVPV